MFRVAVLEHRVFCQLSGGMSFLRNKSQNTFRNNFVDVIILHVSINVVLLDSIPNRINTFDDVIILHGGINVNQVDSILDIRSFTGLAELRVFRATCLGTNTAALSVTGESAGMTGSRSPSKRWKSPDEGGQIAWTSIASAAAIVDGFAGHRNSKSREVQGFVLRWQDGISQGRGKEEERELLAACSTPIWWRDSYRSQFVILDLFRAFLGNLSQ